MNKIEKACDELEMKVFAICENLQNNKYLQAKIKANKKK